MLFEKSAPLPFTSQQGPKRGNIFSASRLQVNEANKVLSLFNIFTYSEVLNTDFLYFYILSEHSSVTYNFFPKAKNLLRVWMIYVLCVLKCERYEFSGFCENNRVKQTGIKLIPFKLYTYYVSCTMLLKPLDPDLGVWFCFLSCGLEREGVIFYDFFHENEYWFWHHVL